MNTRWRRYMIGCLLVLASACHCPASERKIVFARGNDIYIMDVDGSRQARLIRNFGEPRLAAGLSPDGSKIPFEKVWKKDSYISDIFAVNIDDGKQTRLTSVGSAGQPRFSPDGKKIAFTVYTIGASSIDSFIYIMNADGSNPRGLTSDADDENPVFTPDNQKIVFESFPSTIYFDTSPDEQRKQRQKLRKIYTINLDGTDKTLITELPLTQDNAALSPDRRKIVFVKDDDIFIMNVDGTEPKPLTRSVKDDKQPVFSLDGSQIAWTSNRTGRYQIYVMNADGTKQRRLTNSSTDATNPRWR